MTNCPGGLAIEASAGTGKTYALADLATRFLAESEISASELLIVTFTRAATDELRARVRERLIEVADRLEPGHPEVGDDRSPVILRRGMWPPSPPARLRSPTSTPPPSPPSMDLPPRSATRWCPAVWTPTPGWWKRPTNLSRQTCVTSWRPRRWESPRRRAADLAGTARSTARLAGRRIWSSSRPI